MKGRCDDCGNYSNSLSPYDDSFQDMETGKIEYGAFHQWSLCKKCTENHDMRNMRVQMEVAEELEYIRTHPEL